MLLAVCIGMPLIFLFPQIFSPAIFNSRLSYHLILDVEDYLTCSKDYHTFIIDEPDPNVNLLKFYVFNITNAADCLDRGNQPIVDETGPYGYRKKTYKYDVSFDTNTSSSTVSFKEYHYLTKLNESKLCESMFFRMDNAFGELNNPCVDGVCQCADHDATIIVVNPLFLKLLYNEGADSLLGTYSVDVFTEIKSLIEGPFVEASRAHLVTRAYQEIYQFRSILQILPIMKTAYSYLIDTLLFTADQVPQLLYNNTLIKAIGPTECGLSNYSCSFCPFGARGYENIQSRIKLESYAESDYPRPDILFDNTSSISLLTEVGLAKWVALAYYTKELEFGADDGIIMITPSEMTELVANVTDILVNSTYTNPTADQKGAARNYINCISFWLFNSFIYPGQANRVLKTMVFKEFRLSSEPVVCAPLGTLCVWQYGYMNKYRGSDYYINDQVAYQMLDVTTSVNTNPSALYYLGNGIIFYNVYSYFNHVFNVDEDILACQDYSHTYADGSYKQAAGLWAANSSMATTNLTLVYVNYFKQSAETRQTFFYFAGNLTSLMYDVYRNYTEFHDIFVVKYLNKFKDPDFTHDFTVGKWDELGWAQYGGGFVTWALLRVRPLYEVVRNGMWKFGTEKFYSNYIEYGTWCIKVGYPIAYLYDPYDAKDLLYALANTGPVGVKFRSELVYTATTLIGDGSYYVNGIGSVGERAFTPESNKADFSCETYNDTTSVDACRLMNIDITSSGETCKSIDTLNKFCTQQVTFGNEYVVNCNYFQTSMTATQLAIQCNLETIFGKVHPYTKKVGNIVFEMLLALTLNLRVKAGLWCDSIRDCSYEYGGMFVTSTVRQVLFEGFTEPSVLRYLNMKYASKDIKFQCKVDFEDSCGNELLQCDQSGLILNLPNSNTQILEYGHTEHDKFFAPFFEITYPGGEILWRYSMNDTLREHALAVIESQSTEIVKLDNPHWTLYPAWHTDDVAFHKYYQCQKRIFYGEPYLFQSCVDTLSTGREELSTVMNYLSYRGNTSTVTIHPNREQPVFGAAMDQFMQYYPALWDGFISYPYTYGGTTSGKLFQKLTNPTIFDRQFGLPYTLNQDSFIFSFEKDIILNIPITDTWETRTFPKSLPVQTRRFTETVSTWTPFKNLTKPLDSLGMKYEMPYGMVSIERLAGLPFYIGTPHCYGNKLWGGTEFLHVAGYKPSTQIHRTFLDYDPVTGKSIRQSLRQQAMVRVERNSIFMNAFSSQSRCTAPTKAFSGGTGYGCFAYVPLFWYGLFCHLSSYLLTYLLFDSVGTTRAELWKMKPSTALTTTSIQDRAELRSCIQSV